MRVKMHPTTTNYNVCRKQVAWQRAKEQLNIRVLGRTYDLRNAGRMLYL